MLLVGGLVVAIWNQFGVFNNNDVDMSATGQVGDFIGGFAGALWSLAGILLFYSALRLQRKEFALQRKELHDQRQEFATTRIINVIYRQLDNLANRASQLRLTVPTNKVNSSGEQVISDYCQWYTIHFKHKTDARVEQREIFDTFRSFVLTPAATEHLRYLDKSISVCTNLIEQKEFNSETDADEYLLDENVRHQLYILLDSNLDTFLHQRYVTELRRTHEEHEKLIRKINPKAPPMAFMYDHQQIKLLNELNAKLALITKHSRRKPEGSE